MTALFTIYVAVFTYLADWYVSSTGVAAAWKSAVKSALAAVLNRLPQLRDLCFIRTCRTKLIA